MTDTTREKAATKLRFLKETVRELEEYRQLPLKEFNSDRRNELAVERLFQIGLEAMIDTARLIIIEEQLERAQETRSEFAILSDAGIISPDLAIRLTEAKGFRNVLVHDYVSVEKEQVYRNLQTDLEDLKKFVQAIATYLRR